MKVFYYISLLIFTTYVTVVVSNSEVNSEESKQKYVCDDGNFIIVATVDGVLTALNMDSGKLCWTSVLDKETFISSSLSKLEVYDKGYRVFLVPSLDGSLFKYDIVNKIIQPLPVDVDSLITHSAYLDSSTSVFGGKSKVLYGIHRLTGEIIYRCETNSCKVFQETLNENVIVVEEIIQNINAIDSMKGVKKWHFRVVELNIKTTAQESGSSIENKKALIPMQFADFINVAEYKVSLHSGFAARVNGSNEDYSWLFQTTSPITDVWYLKGNSVQMLDPFGKDSGYFSYSMNDGLHTALLFLGTYEKQMFIKKSRNLNIKKLNPNLLSANILYENSSPVCALPQTIDSTKYAKDRDQTELHIRDSKETHARDLVIKDADIYLNVSDHGFYFYINFSIGENATHCILNSSYIAQYGSSHKLNYWLNLTFILFSIASLVLYTMYYKIAQKLCLKVETMTQEPMIQESEAKYVKNPLAIDFMSRFDEDFELISVLGKGGFGVVMDAKNKIDDCHYAVKRICLHEQLNTSQFERVLREVKALAKLEHHGIVRYFNAWIEHPPIGWQEQRDMESNISDVTHSSQSKETSHELKTISHELKTSPKGKSKSRVSAILKKINANPFNLDDSFPENIIDDYESKFSDYSKDTLESSESSSDQSEQDVNLLKGDIVPSETSSDSICDIIFSNDENELNHPYEINQCNEDDDDDSTVYGNSDRECLEEFEEYNMTESNEQAIHPISDLIPINVFQESKSPTENSSYSNSHKILTSGNKTYLINQSAKKQGENSTACEILEKDFTQEFQEESGGSYVQHNSQSPIKVPKHRSKCDFYSLKNTNSSSSSECDTSKKLYAVSCRHGKKQDGSYVFKKHAPRSRKGSEVPKCYLYIQMQLCQKESLRDWLDRNTNSREYDKVMEIFSEIVEAVDYVHNCGLMHRDLKPSNIYFSLEGAIKIGDFGLATSSETGNENSTNSRNLSDTHTSDVGTDIYMSPEQKLERDYDCKTDIYPLGIILFELLVPFTTGTERYKTLTQLRRLTFPDTFIRNFKNESNLVKLLLCDDPKDRPTTNEIKEHPLLLKYSIKK